MNTKHLGQDLDAYLDRELDREAALALDEHLRECPACRRRIAERNALSRMVRVAPYYAAPDRLRRRIVTQNARSRSTRRLLTLAAAAVLVVSVGSGVALLRSSAARADAIATDVVNSHVRSMMANHLFDVESTDKHTVKPWFLGKIDFSPPVTDLAPIGFPLVGGRLDYLEGRPVAALVYQRQKHVINVLVSPVSESAFTRAYAGTIRGFNVHHWIHDDMSFWAVSDLNDAELGEFIRALQTS